MAKYTSVLSQLLRIFLAVNFRASCNATVGQRRAILSCWKQFGALFMGS